MKKLYWSLLGVPLLVGLASYSIAQPGGGKRGGGMMRGDRQGFAFWRAEKIVEKLEITPDQIRQLEEVEYNVQMERIDPEARVEKARLELDHLLAQETYSEEEAGRLSDEIASGSSEIIKLGLNRQIAIREILTPEQWSQLDQLRKGRSRNMRMRGKHQRGAKERRRCGEEEEVMGPEGDEMEEGE